MSIKLNHLRGPFGDETSLYNVSFPEEMTISEFINAVITKYPREWGNIFLFAKGDLITYKNGRYTIHDDNLYNQFKDKQIKEITAQGGWSLMDYTVYIKED